MNSYRTDNALLDSYTKEHKEPDNIVAEMKAVYVPHIYKGGKVIPGFGYSTERIGKGFVTAESAGEPINYM